MTQEMSARGVADRLYLLDGGLAVAPDRSVYSPGTGRGEPVSLPCHACLIRRADSWILWDTGIEDAVAAEPGGRVVAHGIRGIVTRTMRAQLGEIGLAPEDVGTVILSHGHFDHIGNAALFGRATWYMQRREHAAMFGADPARHGYRPSLYALLGGANVVLMDGDCDLFGDGAIRVIFTPGHTPGHCSLLVRLAKTGSILLSGDVAHFRSNLDGRRVPSMNSSAKQTLASMERVEVVAREQGAQLWLNHDAVQAASLPHAPAWLE